jgi:FixJ family two-component response regulator
MSFCITNDAEQNHVAQEVGMHEGRVIAIVDDDESFRAALEMFLTTSGFQISAFASGEEFLRSAELQMVGCAILDFEMPGMNGLAVLRQLRVLGLRLAVIVVTAHGESGVEERARAEGAIAFLRKPLDHEKLLRAVDSALGLC